LDSEPLKTEVLFPQGYEAGCTLKGSKNPVFLNQAGFRDPGFMNRHDFWQWCVALRGETPWMKPGFYNLDWPKKERGRVRRCDCLGWAPHRGQSRDHSLGPGKV